jgi:phage gp16-like protein
MDESKAATWSQASRARQLEKIEALLTIGGKSWAYGDAMAKRICKVDKITWVADGDLYKIITALRKQAQRDGWDLSGEG